MIQPIIYNRIEQKKEIEREMFAKLSREERHLMTKAWMDFVSWIRESATAQKSAKKK